MLSSEELLAFFGLLLMSEVPRSSHLNYKYLWATDGKGIEFFQTIMSCNRFLFILRFVLTTAILEKKETTWLN